MNIALPRIAEGHAQQPKGSRQALALNHRGGLLVETALALAFLGVLGIGILGAVQTGNIAKGKFEVQSVAENLLRNQMESALAEPYQVPGTSYTSIDAPEGYTVTAEALVYDLASTAVETIRVTVYRQGQPVQTLETLRALR